MKPSLHLLDLPAETTARVLAGRSLRKAAAASRRLAEREDDAELKKLRIALRRLRDALRTYRPYLEDAVGRKDRRRLRGLLDSTGAVRDLDVQLGWLRSGRGTWKAVEAVGRDWMLRRTEDQREEAEAALHSELERRISGLRHRLERRLESYVVRVDPESVRPPLPSRVAVAGEVERLTARLRAGLERVNTVADQEEAHRARIAARRLRYLLDPFRAESGNAAEAVKEARALQGLLGDLHDGEVIRRRIAHEVDALGPDQEEVRAGLLDLAEQLRVRRDIVFGEIEANWLHGGAEPLLARLQALAAELRGAAGEALEIERKFLLRGMPPLPEGATSVRIEQGWLPGERLLERVRSVTSDDGPRWYRTVKLGSGVQRVEIEEETTASIFAALWPLTEGRRIRKQRFLVPADGRVWEIDRFDDLDLVLAEVELDSPDDAVSLPDWLEPLVEREVTDEPAYVNANLAG